LKTQSMVLLVVVAIISGCVSPAERQQQWLADARSSCAAFGFTDGTSEFSRCMQDTYNTYILADQQQRSAAAVAGAVIAAQPAQAPPPQQTVTRCVPDTMGGMRCRSD